MESVYFDAREPGEVERRIKDGIRAFKKSQTLCLRNVNLFLVRRIGFCRSPDMLFPNNPRHDGECEPR